MKIKFNGEFSSQEVVEHVSKYLAKFFDKYPIKSVKGISVYFNMYSDDGTRVTPGRNGEPIEIMEITDPHKISKKRTKDNIIQMPVVEVIEITSGDLERKELEREQKRSERRRQEMIKAFEEQNRLSQEKRRQTLLAKKKAKELEQQNISQTTQSKNKP